MLHDPKFEKYYKMLKMLPEGPVRQKMSAEGFKDAEIETFLAQVVAMAVDAVKLIRQVCGACESITLLFVRDNQLCSLPDELGALRNLRVLDVAGNRLAHLPYSLGENTALSAIWLAENQATGKIKLQADFDEREHKEVLTCYLLPQHNYVEPPPHQQQQQR